MKHAESSFKDQRVIKPNIRVEQIDYITKIDRINLDGENIEIQLKREGR